ncbi:MAG: hypothetical protein OXD45_00230 [Rhodobacteraceae bacterium]|nr:hypothetical protein [Paracoccaceae bacterium]
MRKSVAVLAIHGMGSQGGNKRPNTPKQLTFSRNLHNRVVKEFNKKEWNFENVAWHEVFWADILQQRQDDYLNEIKRGTRWHRIRRFMVRNISDEAAYRQIPNANTYERIHQRIDETLLDLQQVVDDDVRLIILAHSLGGHIMSNYLWDSQGNKPTNSTPFRKAETLMAFVSFGCNIPLFTFAYSPNDVKPISRPGTSLKGTKYYLETWWHNYYDKDDVLGYPLRDIGNKYTKMVTDRELKDIPINAGNLLTFWNLLSHNAYWKPPDFFKPVAKLIKEAI